MTILLLSRVAIQVPKLIALNFRCRLDCRTGGLLMVKMMTSMTYSPQALIVLNAPPAQNAHKVLHQSFYKSRRKLSHVSLQTSNSTSLP